MSPQGPAGNTEVASPRVGPPGGAGLSAEKQTSLEAGREAMLTPFMAQLEGISEFFKKNKLLLWGVSKLE